MILMWESPFWGPLEGVSPENRDFLGPETVTSEVSAILAQKSWDFQGPPLPMDFPASKSLSPSAI